MPDALRLQDQGYSFHVITKLDGISELPGLVYPTKSEQIELLQSVLLASEDKADVGGDVKGHADDLAGVTTSKDFGKPGVSGTHKTKGGVATAKRIPGSLTALSGADSMSCASPASGMLDTAKTKLRRTDIEQNKSANKTLDKSGKSRHSLFAKRDQRSKKK
jgi:DNA excision repair protein ERCC-3